MVSVHHRPRLLVLQECRDGEQLLAGHFQQELVEPRLPLVAVSHDGNLDGRAVQQDEVLVHQGVLLLDIVGHFRVPEQTHNKVCYL